MSETDCFSNLFRLFSFQKNCSLISHLCIGQWLISNLYDLPRELASGTRVNPCSTVGEVFLDAIDLGCCSPEKYVQKLLFNHRRGGFHSMHRLHTWEMMFRDGFWKFILKYRSRFVQAGIWTQDEIEHPHVYINVLATPESAPHGLGVWLRMPM